MYPTRAATDTGPTTDFYAAVTSGSANAHSAVVATSSVGGFSPDSVKQELPPPDACLADAVGPRAGEGFTTATKENSAEADYVEAPMAHGICSHTKGLAGFSPDQYQHALSKPPFYGAYSGVGSGAAGVGSSSSNGQYGYSGSSCMGNASGRDAYAQVFQQHLGQYSLPFPPLLGTRPELQDTSSAATGIDGYIYNNDQMSMDHAVALQYQQQHAAMVGHGGVSRNNIMSRHFTNQHTPHHPALEAPRSTGQARVPYEWIRAPYKTAASTGSSYGKTRTKDKYRVVYSDHQRLELEKEFCYSKYITIKRKSELAQSLNLSERQVKIWFQNRRAKERKYTKKREENAQLGSDDSASGAGGHDFLGSLGAAGGSTGAAGLPTESSNAHLMPDLGKGVGSLFSQPS